MEKLTKYFDFFCLLGDSKRHRYDEELRQIFIQKKLSKYFKNEYERIAFLRLVFSSCFKHSFINPFLIALLGLAKIEKPTLCEEFVEEINEEIVERLARYDYMIKVNYERLFNYTYYGEVCADMIGEIENNGIDFDFYKFGNICCEIVEKVYFDKKTGKICLKMDSLTLPERFVVGLIYPNLNFLGDMVFRCEQELEKDLEDDTRRYYIPLEE
ncbi:MAG: hypothetical protein LWW95_08160 [Candidatus Desulfofervidus auxilii]|nr:hypothetical protein [Candidatus Desulfofervidus auxilii]